MKLKTKIAFALTAIIAATAQPVAALDLQSGGQVKPRVTKVQLGIVSPQEANCPTGVPIKSWIFSNKPSTFPILLVASNGVVKGPYMVETKKGANGVTMGVWETEMMFGSSTSIEYKVVTPGSSASSNWVPLNVSC